MEKFDMTIKPYKLTIIRLIVNLFVGDYVLFCRTKKYTSLSVHTCDENVEMMEKMLQQIKNNKQTKFTA